MRSHIEKRDKSRREGIATSLLFKPELSYRPLHHIPIKAAKTSAISPGRSCNAKRVPPVVNATTTFVSVLAEKPSKIGRTALFGVSRPADTRDAIEIAVAWVSAKPDKVAPRKRPRLPWVWFRNAQKKRIALTVAAKKIASFKSNARPGLGSCVTCVLEVRISNISAYATIAIPERSIGVARARHVSRFVTSRTITICNTVATLERTAAEVAALVKSGSLFARWPMVPMVAVDEMKPPRKPAMARPNREPKARKAM